MFYELSIIGGLFWSNEVIRGQIMSYFFLDHSQGRIQLSNFIKFIEVRALSNILFITNQFISTCTQYKSRGSFSHVMIFNHVVLVESTGGHLVSSLLHLKQYLSLSIVSVRVFFRNHHQSSGDAVNHVIQT